LVAFGLQLLYHRSQVADFIFARTELLGWVFEKHFFFLLYLLFELLLLHLALFLQLQLLFPMLFELFLLVVIHLD